MQLTQAESSDQWVKRLAQWLGCKTQGNFFLREAASVSGSGHRPWEGENGALKLAVVLATAVAGDAATAVASADVANADVANACVEGDMWDAMDCWQQGQGCPEL